MTITVQRTAAGFTPDQVESRYVRLGFDGVWRWCEVGSDRRYDLRTGTCEETDLPVEVANAAKIRRAGGVWPFYVDWPEPDAYGRTGEESSCAPCEGTGVEYQETCVTCGGFGWVRT
jgi:hypothetical protein